MTLRAKRILITAGPTWVPIDSVRVISNTATGETGILLAEELQNSGAKVTLLLGPVGICCLNKKMEPARAKTRGRQGWNTKAALKDGVCERRSIRLLRFKFFAELKNRLIRELKTRKYDAVIHTAAVSDYQPKNTYPQKIKSGKKSWRIDLVPTRKIIDLVKKIDPALFLVGFKFETKINKGILIEKTRSLMRQAKLDLAVANTLDKNKYRAYIINDHKIYGPILKKVGLVNKLAYLIGDNLCKN